MKIELIDDTYLATIAFEQRARFRSDGWTWNNHLKKWTTRNRKHVIPWLAFCVGKAREVLDEQLAHEAERMAPSMATDAAIDIPVPNALRIKDRQPYAYRPYQRAGIAFIAAHKDTLLADPPGLGKTIQAIGASNLDPSIRRVLLIVPAFLKIHWQRFWEEWDVKHLSVGIAGSRAYQKNKQIIREKVWPDTDVVIINKEIMPDFDAQIKSIVWDMLVVDEWHRGFTNPKALCTKALYGGNYKPPKTRKKKGEDEAGSEEVPSDQSEETLVLNRDANDGSPDTAVDTM